MQEFIKNYIITRDGIVIKKATGLVLKQKPTSSGYLEVCLFNEGKRKYVTVHRLVAMVYLPNPQDKPQVNHIDANKHNNHVNNLEWCTTYENMQHAERHGLVKTHGRETAVRVTNLYTDETILFTNCRVAARYFNLNKTYFSNMLSSFQYIKHPSNEWVVQTERSDLNEYYVI